MSVTRSSKCLFCTFKQASKRSEPIARRHFHPSPLRSKNQESDDPVDQLEHLTEKEVQDNFTPAQAEAIKQTQKHLKFGKEFKQGTVADNKPWTMSYFQNLTEIDPIADKPVKAPWSNFDDNSRLKTNDEFDEDILKFMQNMPEDEDEAAEAWSKFLGENRITVGKAEHEYNPRSAESPVFPTMKRDDIRSRLKEVEDGAAASMTRAATSTTIPKKKKKDQRGSSDVKEETSPALIRLMQMTGYSSSELSKLRTKTLISHRVVNQTRLGKIQKMYFLSISGNGNGLLGVGEGKAEDSMEAMLQSQYRAIRNMQPVRRYEKRTIFGNVEGKSGATELELYTRPPGFGLRCQHYIFEMCRAAGIADLAARVTRARNPMNTVKAAFQALQSQKDPEEIAKGRGKKLVDVRKVYYAGNV